MSPELRDETWARIRSSLARGDAGSVVREPGGQARRAGWIAIAMAMAAAAILGWVGREVLVPRREPSPHQAARTVDEARAQRPAALREPTPPSRSRSEPNSTDRSGDEVPPQAVVSTSTRPRPRSPRAVAPVAADIDRLQAELALLSAAERALAAGDAATALERLRTHEREHPDGQLLEDRLALRIRALCAAGKTPQARGEARVFTQRFPRSAHHDRLAATCVAPG